MTKQIVIDKSRRIELPEEVLEALKVRPGDAIRIRTREDGEVVIEQRNSILDLFGSIDPKGIRLTDEDIGRIIEQEAIGSVGGRYKHSASSYYQ